MKQLVFITLLLFTSARIKAQKVFSVDSDYKADVKVFVDIRVRQRLAHVEDLCVN